MPEKNAQYTIPTEFKVSPPVSEITVYNYSILLAHQPVAHGVRTAVPCLHPRTLSSQSWTPGEAAELWDRRRKLLLYLLRSPFLDSFLK